MATTDINLADRSGSLVESHKGYDPRIIFFYFIIAALLLTLAGGLAYQQLSKTGEHADAERQQNQRRILVPGPRGNIYDRNQKLLVGNRPRFSVRLLLDVLRPEIRREQIRIRKNYRAMDDQNVPSPWQLEQIARVSVVQRYLDEVNRVIGREERVDARELQRHFSRELLLPFTLIDDLEPKEYARLLEKLPVNSPANVYSFSTRYYPYGSAASHTLGYVGSTDDLEVEDLPGDDLRTFKMKGTMGRDGIEKRFDSLLQGEAGGSIFRVDPAGNRINPAIQVVLPKQGRDLTLSLDIDLQLAAEKTLGETEMAGTAIAMDVNTGEVLVLASKPDYDLSQFSPRISTATWADANARGALFKRAIQGTYPPGSSFKILMTIAGLRSGVITPEGTAFCPGFFRLGREFDCHDRHAHGELAIEEAIERSCNVFFYEHGYKMGPDVIAAEARRFHLDQPTGIELTDETRRMIIPNPEWKRKTLKQAWVGGDTVLMSIGQGYVSVSPLSMACFMASVARDEVWTQPTLLHQPNRPRQKTESIGLTPAQRAALVNGMERVTTGASGTARILQNGRGGLPPLTGLRIAAKTGTAQAHTVKGTINFAWLIAFAPVENPQIAIAIAIEGDTPGEETGGGRYASPVAHAILRTWLDKKNQPAGPPVKFKTE
ncbi:MAG: penicillin-binding transpeptidase domain-containing protein [Opitutaceae bacterium]|nr:penicillin-binding transpeptidase domain-containing protein [Opitutaceae bacterium]